MLYESIKKLVQYGIDTGLTPECERIYTINLLLDVFHEDNWEDVSCDLTDLVLEDILADLLKEAVTRGIIEDSIGYRDLFDTRLMNCLLPRPAQVQNDFWRHYQESPESALSFITSSVRTAITSAGTGSKGPQMDCRHRLRNTGYYHQSVPNRKRSESHCRCAQCFCFGLPEMSALYGERRVCRTPRSPGQRESPHHSDHGQ